MPTKYPQRIIRSLLTWCNPCSPHTILWHRSYVHITSSMNAACYQYSERIMSTMNTSWYLATNHVIHDRIILSISTLVYVMQSKPSTPNFINVLNTSSPNTYVISQHIISSMTVDEHNISPRITSCHLEKNHSIHDHIMLSTNGSYHQCAYYEISRHIMSSTRSTHHLGAPRANDKDNLHGSEINQLHVSDNGSSSKDWLLSWS